MSTFFMIYLFYLILGCNFQMTITFLIIKIERPGLCHFKAIDLHFPGTTTIFQEHVSNSRNSRNRTNPALAVAGAEVKRGAQLKDLRSEIPGIPLANQEPRICYVINRQIQNGRILMKPVNT